VFRSIRTKPSPAKSPFHGSVPTVERTKDEGAIIGGSVPEEPRRMDPDAIAGAKTPSSKHLVGPSKSNLLISSRERCRV
jgi:hypothetical protein